MFWLVGLLAAFCVGGIAASATRGPWVDEFWTIWQSRHDIPLDEVFWQRWAADFHPPLFSFVHWLLTALLGEAMFPHRLLNVLPLAGATAFAVLCARRYPRSFDVVGLYGLLLLSFPVTLQYFAETRSYFWQLCVIYVLAGASMVALDAERDLDWHDDGALAAVLGLAIGIGLNLHYFASLLSGMVLCAVAALCWRHGLRRWSRFMLTAGALASVPLLMFVLAQRGFLSQESGHYWVTGGARQAFDRLSNAARAGLGANAVVSIAAVTVVLAWLDRIAGRVRGQGIFAESFVQNSGPTGRRAELLVGLSVVSLVYAVGLLLLHARQPIVYARYLIAFQGLIIALIALAAARLIASWRAVAVLAVAFSFCGAAYTAWRTAHEERWDATARAAAAAARACPGAVVRGVAQDRTKGSRNSQTVLRWAYDREGALWGFKPVPLVTGGEVEALGQCPAIFWVEHADPGEVKEAVAAPAVALRRFGLDPSAFDVDRAKATAGASGYVLVVPHRHLATP